MNDSIVEKTVKKILFIGHLWPEPSSSAAGYRTLAILETLAHEIDDNNQNIYSITFACAAEKTKYAANLDILGITSKTIILNSSTFDDFIEQLQPDIVFYDRFISEEQFAPRVQQHCPQAINILDTQDLHFLRRARQKAVNSQNALDLYSNDTIREIAAIMRCDLSLIISSYEMQLLIKQFHLDQEILHYCPFMLETPNSSNNISLSYQQRQHFVMIGNFLHEPNWDAVLWCYQSIWPEIRKQLPEAQLHIYGAYSSDKVYALHQPKKGFFIKGRANDVLETMGQYRVNLAPLRFGAGIKGKIADGFLCQTPCITTEIGFEGMCENLSDWPGLVTPTDKDNQTMAKQFAQQAISLYNNIKLWQHCQSKTDKIIKQAFDKKEHGMALIKTLHKLSDHHPQQRKNNFIGQILRHNLYRSQYYMSKWIEEKNK